MAHWGTLALVMAVGAGISLAGSGTHTVEYVVDVRGEFRGELYVRYVDSDDRLVTETLAAPSWRERVEATIGRTDEVRVLATLAPVAGAAGRPEPTVSCAIVVDGVERARETGARVVTCRFDLADLAPPSSPSLVPPGDAPSPGDGTGSVLLWSSVGVAAALAALWWWRSRAPAPAGGPEPHVRFMVISGAIAVVLAVGGFFVSCNAPPTAPPGLDIERGLP